MKFYFILFYFFNQSSLILQIQQRNNRQCQKLIFSKIKLNVMMNELIYRCGFEIFFLNLKVSVLLLVCQIRQGREEIVNLKCCSTKMQLVTHCFSEKKMAQILIYLSFLFFYTVRLHYIDSYLLSHIH